jgi:hypothetical protein
MFERIQKNSEDLMEQDLNDILFITIRDAILFIMSENEHSSNL